MITLLSIAHAFAACNLHFCLYTLLSVHALQRVRLCAEPHQQEERRERLIHAFLYFLLGLL